MAMAVPRDLPLVANIDFGHTSPMLTVPIGGEIEVAVAGAEITVGQPAETTARWVGAADGVVGDLDDQYRIVDRARIVALVASACLPMFASDSATTK